MSTNNTEIELTDEQILQFEQQIKDEEAQKIPLVCQDEPLLKLEEEFKDNEPFLQKIKNLSRKHNRIRKCRGDGNCFFRAFAFAWFESALHDNDKFKTALARLKMTPKLLEKGGFQPLAFEDFYEITVEQFENIPKYASDPDMFLVNFQSEEISNAIVMHLRFVASAYLRVHADEYEPFLVAEMISIDEFCAMHVEAFGRESDHLQIIALAKALDTPVEVIYLDGSSDSEAAVHEFWPDESQKGQRQPLQLIYRPGHYDILY
ncbi:peptidase C65 Otubain-domain-containing protein [Halteromyces radiatus]|uniref:peptidase C65 Otubain-domain-containing protein n=1 Tax=Halteromyces radiatus TaxID=101107 RepID=UPI00221F50A7|nr:peptidase C65 Otubain-domain-containing protein [Halteromyces radiatus]KAI8086029.1 peptidase C65 Otubain-domain-containing protein [Halteromyces radiatus]